MIRISSSCFSVPSMIERHFYASSEPSRTRGDRFTWWIPEQGGRPVNSKPM